MVWVEKRTSTKTVVVVGLVGMVWVENNKNSKTRPPLCRWLKTTVQLVDQGCGGLGEWAYWGGLGGWFCWGRWGGWRG